MRLVLPRFDFQLTKKGEYYSMFHILFIRFFLLFLKGVLYLCDEKFMEADSS